MPHARLLRAAAAAAVLVALACGRRASAEPFGMLSMDDVEKLVGRPGVVLVDANPEDVYRKNHLPGARWWRSAPLAALLPADKDQRVVFYCASPS
jgi:rhodanese-related sulfurtransferase